MHLVSDYAPTLLSMDRIKLVVVVAVELGLVGEKGALTCFVRVWLKGQKFIHLSSNISSVCIAVP